MGNRGVKANKTSIAITFQYRGMQCRETVRLDPTKANIKYASRLKAEIDRKIELGTFSYIDYFPNSRTKTSKLFTPQAANLSIETALNRYIASVQRTLSATTYREYISSSKRIIEGIGSHQVASISALEIREWIYSLKCSAKRVNNILVPLRGTFKDLHMDGTIDKNPMDRIKNLKIEKHEPDPFNQDELRRILEVVEPVSANMIQFAAWTGLRTGELFALTWGDVDMVAKTCRINKTITRGELKLSPKTSSGFRTIELLPKAIEALQAQKPFSFLADKHVWLQHDTMTNFTNDDQLRKRVWLKAIKKSGVQYRPPYQLRHTFASTILSAGANPMWVAQQMGHADWGMIRKIYGKWIEQDVSEVDRVSALLNDKSSFFSSSTAIKKTKNP